MSDESEATRSALLRASRPPPAALFSTLITANHILHFHNVVDAYGHVSIRNPQDPETFFLSRSLAPALVSSLKDLQEYRVSDASPLEDDAPKGYAERYIHSEIYKKYRDVNSVIHAHAEAVLPFGISSVPLRPVYHMAGVMGPQPPVFDAALHYKASDAQQSLLVTAPHLGAALAAAFNPSSAFSAATSLIKNYITSTTPEPPAFPPSPVVLMRGHGFSCVGATIEEAVYRAVFTCANARLQAAAMSLQGQYNLGLVAEHFGQWDRDAGVPRGQAKQKGIKFLSEREVKDSWAALKETVGRAWELWCADVDGDQRYRNEMEEVEAS